MTNSTPNQLPETTRPTTRILHENDAIAFYDAVNRNRIIDLARTDGVEMVDLGFRVYGDRIQWRLNFKYKPSLSNEDAKLIAWQVVVKGFGAFEPKFYRRDDGAGWGFTAAWFTNGASEAEKQYKVTF